MRTQWNPEFVPATDKLEAVNRISRAVGGPPEELGPGSKERKSVLVTLAIRLGISPVEQRRSKPELGGVICSFANKHWDSSCWSTGSTITLEGLNRLLEIAERVGPPQSGEAQSDMSPSAEETGSGARRAVETVVVDERTAPVSLPLGLPIGTPSPRTSRSSTEEARLIESVVVPRVPRHFDGKLSVEAMLAGGSRNWAQSEWPGFFFEHLVIGPLVARLGGGPLRVPGARTTFDYASKFIWDLKTHSSDGPLAILNDQLATKWALAQGGMGLVLLSGRPEYTPGFREWHDDFKVRNGRRPNARRREVRFHRDVKSGFSPERLDLLFFPGHSAWETALGQGVVRPHAQGRQPDGQKRNPKFALNVPAAVASEWCITSIRLDLD